MLNMMASNDIHGDIGTGTGTGTTDTGNHIMTYLTSSPNRLLYRIDENFDLSMGHVNDLHSDSSTPRRVDTKLHYQGDEWRAAKTPGGRIYYYNKRTNASSWRLPSSVELVDTEADGVRFIEGCSQPSLSLMTGLETPPSMDSQRRQRDLQITYSSLPEPLELFKLDIAMSAAGM